MRTYHPYAEFNRCARVFDPTLLTDQLVLTLRFLCGLGYHGFFGAEPCALPPEMLARWERHAVALTQYGTALCDEEARRNEIMRPPHPLAAQFEDLHDSILRYRSHELKMRPSWLLDPHLHEHDRGLLIDRNPEHYRQYFPQQ